jgi:hypothetical protein
MTAVIVTNARQRAAIHGTTRKMPDALVYLQDDKLDVVVACPRTRRAWHFPAAVGPTLRIDYDVVAANYDVGARA